ncbi:Hypothetical predicted protein [Mytilus galloprovincialis]|uniref:Reverse transcriptase domain-containing protein n=1 Tax=Mytilus galloprovincialis TaxID=29158 RepID=A0A8B6CZ72_MYTGA|nr:Hypothetical predicted protein [Mytilus galloprovincialis]
MLLQVDKSLGMTQFLLFGTVANFTLAKRLEILDKSTVSEALQQRLVSSPLSKDKLFSVSLGQLQEEVNKAPPVVKVDVKVTDGKRFVKTTQVNNPSSSHQPKASSSSSFSQHTKRSAFSRPIYSGWKKAKVVKGKKQEGCVDGGKSSFSSRVLFPAVLKNGIMRSVLDLSVLNQYLVVPHFKMETNRSIRSTIHSGIWTTSLDLMDAYFHIPISHKFRHFLRLVWWWLQEKHLVKGVLLDPPTPTLNLFTDANLMGWGAYLEGRTVVGQSSRYESGVSFSPSVSGCSSESVTTGCHSTAVDYLQNQGETHSFSLYHLSKKSLLLCHSLDMILSVRHVPGSQNLLADALSRSRVPVNTEWEIHPSVFQTPSKR